MLYKYYLTPYLSDLGKMYNFINLLVFFFCYEVVTILMYTFLRKSKLRTNLLYLEQCFKVDSPSVQTFLTPEEQRRM